MIIYPPLIGDTIPGFTATQPGETIVIPFRHNPAVSLSGVQGMRAIIKDITTSQIVAQGYYTADKFEITDTSASFIISSGTLIQGVFYKFQLAYDDAKDFQNTLDEAELNNLYLSTVAIGRCVSAPSMMKIDQLDIESLANPNLITYNGIFQPGDQNEPAYRYRFIVKEQGTERVIQDTDWKTPASENNYFTLDYELDIGKYYTIAFSVVTVNGYEQTIEYTILQSEEYVSTFEGNIIATSLPEEGCVQITLSGTPVNGNFELLRTKDHKYWDCLTQFKMETGFPLDVFSWKDISVEHGVEYTYALRQYATNPQTGTTIVSRKTPQTTIRPQYEDMFLSDANKTLRICFDPKVSSFKNTILEQKTDTIGGQYPFFFRNGKVKYKEIPISGLISYHMDGNEMFMNNQELGLISNDIARKNTVAHNEQLQYSRTTQLTDYNISAERTFKLAVLEWLNNGQPKLFRSPTEGAYVVRLMNVSLSPNDTLGRMLHTFSATAYECMEPTYSAMRHKDIVDIPAFFMPSPQGKYMTLNKIYSQTADTQGNIILQGYFQDITYTTSAPGTNVYIEVDGNKFYNVDGEIFIPGLAHEIIIPKIVNNFSTLTYIEYDMISQTQIAVSDFLNQANSTIQTVSYPPGTELSLPLTNEYIWEYIYIGCYPTDTTRNCKMTIGNEIIDLADGNARYYKYIKGNTPVYRSADSYVHLDISYRKGAN